MRMPMRNIPMIGIGQKASSARNHASSWCSRANEREVLDPIAAGRSNVQIAAALHLSPKTVRDEILEC
jgi:DNA-binding CsgD family transcriptional regulator